MLEAIFVKLCDQTSPTIPALEKIKKHQGALSSFMQTAGEKALVRLCNHPLDHFGQIANLIALKNLVNPSMGTLQEIECIYQSNTEHKGYLQAICRTPIIEIPDSPDPHGEVSNPPAPPGNRR